MVYTLVLGGLLARNAPVSGVESTRPNGAHAAI
jgi:hypothetical protein